jgi:hypothetical protein
MIAALVESVGDVEPFYGVFVNTATDLNREGASKAERWRARRAWMSFMRENAEEYAQRWPHMLSDLAALLMEMLTKGKGGENFLENIRAILEIIEPHLPQEEEEETPTTGWDTYTPAEEPATTQNEWSAGGEWSTASQGLL